MNLTRDRIHTIGWGTALALCLAVTAAVSARVSAEKSQAALAARQVAALRQQIGYLQTEFETRANQQALQQLNATEFGYEAPTAAQYLSGERQLAALSQPAAPGAPPPVRFAGNDVGGDGAVGAGVATAAGPVRVALGTVPAGAGAGVSARVLRASLRARLSRLDGARPDEPRLDESRLGDAGGISRE